MPFRSLTTEEQEERGRGKWNKKIIKKKIKKEINKKHHLFALPIWPMEDQEMRTKGKRKEKETPFV